MSSAPMLKTDEDRLARFDVDAIQNKHSLRDTTTTTSEKSRAAAVSSSWVHWYVVFPSRLALALMMSIIGYEVLVCVSMGVRRVRYVMVNGLMYLLLSFNLLLVLVLVLYVIKTRRDLNVGHLTSKFMASEHRVVAADEAA